MRKAVRGADSEVVEGGAPARSRSASAPSLAAPATKVPADFRSIIPPIRLPAEICGAAIGGEGDASVAQARSPGIADSDERCQGKRLEPRQEIQVALRWKRTDGGSRGSAKETIEVLFGSSALFVTTGRDVQDSQEQSRPAASESG